MIRRDPLGIYELFVPDIGEGELYKFLIETQNGQKLYKADPFANICGISSGYRIEDRGHFKDPLVRQHMDDCAGKICAGSESDFHL